MEISEEGYVGGSIDRTQLAELYANAADDDLKAHYEQVGAEHGLVVEDGKLVDQPAYSLRDYSAEAEAPAEEAAEEEAPAEPEAEAESEDLSGLTKAQLVERYGTGGDQLTKAQLIEALGG